MSRFLHTVPLSKYVQFSSQTHVKLVQREFLHRILRMFKGLKIHLKSHFFTCLLLQLFIYQSKIDLSLQIGKCISPKTGFILKLEPQVLLYYLPLCTTTLNPVICFATYMYHSFFPFLCQLMHALH